MTQLFDVHMPKLTSICSIKLRRWYFLIGVCADGLKEAMCQEALAMPQHWQTDRQTIQLIIQRCLERERRWHSL